MIILVINCGSSSVKYQLLDMKNDDVYDLLAKGLVEKIGLPDGCLTHKPTGKEPYTVTQSIPDHKVGMKLVLDALVDPEHGVLKSFDDIEAVAASLHKGYELVLIRNPSNAYDANAVAVATSAGVRFGWIPRTLNAELALRLDKGQSLKAAVDFAIPGNGCAEIAISVVNA